MSLFRVLFFPPFKTFSLAHEESALDPHKPIIGQRLCTDVISQLYFPPLLLDVHVTWGLLLKLKEFMFLPQVRYSLIAWRFSLPSALRGYRLGHAHTFPSF